MLLFQKNSKKESSKSGCCKGNYSLENLELAQRAKIEGASIKVLGSGCTKCYQLEVAVKQALKQLNMDTTIDHITDYVMMAAYGVMTTPALVVDEKVVSYGKVLSVDEIVRILQKARGIE